MNKYKLKLDSLVYFTLVMMVSQQVRMIVNRAESQELTMSPMRRSL